MKPPLVFKLKESIVAPARLQRGWGTDAEKRGAMVSGGWVVGQMVGGCVVAGGVCVWVCVCCEGGVNVKRSRFLLRAGAFKIAGPPQGLTGAFKRALADVVAGAS